MFNMKKRLKRYGNNLVLVFTKEEEEIYGLIEGDIIDIEDMVIQDKKSRKLNKKRNKMKGGIKEDE